jgi:hypothetical protein
MNPLLCSVPTLALSVIFCLYRGYRADQRRRRRLHERVTYMLWVMACDMADDPPSAPQEQAAASAPALAGSAADRTITFCRQGPRKPTAGTDPWSNAEPS